MWIIDIDGTTALRQDGGRHWSDWDRVGEDLPNGAVVTIIRALAMAGEGLVWLSARPEQCRGLTHEWLHRYVCLPPEGKSGVIQACDAPMFLAADGDNRGDPVIKRELYETQIVPVYGEAEGVLDDRAGVVKMWRHELRRTVLSCADGFF